MIANLITNSNRKLNLNSTNMLPKYKTENNYRPPLILNKSPHKIQPNDQYKLAGIMEMEKENQRLIRTDMALPIKTLNKNSSKPLISPRQEHSQTDRSKQAIYKTSKTERLEVDDYCCANHHSKKA
jgi:hypothetical protein